MTIAECSKILVILAHIEEVMLKSKINDKVAYAIQKNKDIIYKAMMLYNDGEFFDSLNNLKKATEKIAEIRKEHNQDKKKKILANNPYSKDVKEVADKYREALEKHNKILGSELVIELHKIDEGWIIDYPDELRKQAKSFNLTY